MGSFIRDAEKLAAAQEALARREEAVLALLSELERIDPGGAGGR